MLGYWYRRFGSKIAWANRQEGDSRVWVQVQSRLWRLTTYMEATGGLHMGRYPPQPALYPDPPLLCHSPAYWLRLFSSQTSCINTPTFLKPSHSAPTCLWRWNRQNVPKQHIKFRCLGITQKKAYKSFDLYRLVIGISRVAENKHLSMTNCRVVEMFHKCCRIVASLLRNTAFFCLFVCLFLFCQFSEGVA